MADVQPFFLMFHFKPQVSRALSEEDDVYSVLPKLMKSQNGCAVDEGYSNTLRPCPDRLSTLPMRHCCVCNVLNTTHTMTKTVAP